MDELCWEYKDYLRIFYKSKNYADFKALQILKELLDQKLKPYHGLETVCDPSVCLRFFNTLGFSGRITTQFSTEICKTKKAFKTYTMDVWAHKLLEKLYYFECFHSSLWSEKY